MNRSSETMLIAGENGGKSTFTGALITYLNRTDTDESGKFDFQYGDRTEFENKILDQMQNYEYPEQTDSPYLVQIQFDVNQDWNPETKVDIMDIPGEEQEQAIDRIVNGNWDPEEVRDRYLNGNNSQGGQNNTSVKNRIENYKDLVGEEWQTAYLYRYERSEQVVFIVNLHKRIKEQRDLMLTPDIIDKIADEKRKVVLLVAATDTLDIVPNHSQSIVEKWGMSPTQSDDDLYDQLNNKLNATYADLLQIIREANDNDRVDLFGISVPEDSGGRLKINNHAFEMNGFERVISWLK